MKKNPNWFLNLILIHGGNHRDTFFDISIILVKYITISHSLEKSPLTPRVDNPILVTDESFSCIVKTQKRWSKKIYKNRTHKDKI